jgi:UDP-2-acetamido-3-amino-2,3-dideoxy-glucuronate N-acetyltransferase
VARKVEGQAVPLATEEPLRRECLHFLECVRDRETPRTDGENGVQVLKILHAAGQSTQSSGHPVILDEKVKPDYFVHASAFVDEPCEIGAGTKIWHFSHVMAESRIGSRCNIGQNVCIAANVKIGNNVKIQNNVSLYTGVELEDDVFCGPSAVFTNVLTPRSHVNRKSEYRRTLVQRGASLGANSTIVCGVTIGRYAFVGAGAVVTRDVPDHALVVGVPAKQIGWVCQCGLRLNLSDGLGVCATCGSAYMANDETLIEIPSALRSSGTPVQAQRAAAGAD